jgi:hypothetical protein
MRIFQYVDLIAQTSLLVLGIIAFVPAPFDLKNSFFLFIQFCVGAAQMTSCSLSILLRASLFKAKSFHFAGAIVYLLSLPIIGISSSNKIFWALYLILPSWGLAFFYYFLTWKAMATKKNGGKFLPHLSF